MVEFFMQPIPSGIGLFLVINVPIWAMIWWFRRWDRRQSEEINRHWAQEDAERQRRWDLQQQQRDMEQQIWDEQLSDEERERRREAQARVAEVRREARRRLGLPEEEG
jgi:flagellar biosynthesis component FlhA